MLTRRYGAQDCGGTVFCRGPWLAMVLQHQGWWDQWSIVEHFTTECELSRAVRSLPARFYWQMVQIIGDRAII